MKSNDKVKQLHTFFLSPAYRNTQRPFPSMKKLLFLLFSALTVACNNPGNNLPRHISETVLVSTVSNDNLLDTSEIEMEYVTSLKLPKDIQSIASTKFTFEQDHFLIMDGKANSCVLVFDSTGNFISRLGSRGRAKNEYVQAPTDYFVRADKQVCVFERESRRVLTFSMSGELTDMTRFKMFPYSLCVTDSNNYLCALNHKEAKDGLQLALISPDENILKGYLHLDGNYKYVTSDRTFFKCDDIIYHVPNLSDSILVFHEDSITKVIRLSFDCDFVPDRIKKDIYKEDMDEYHGFKGIKTIMEYYETGKYIFIKYKKSILALSTLIDKNTNKQYCFSSVPFEGLFPPCNLYVKDDKIYFLITKEDVSLIKDSMSPDELKRNLRDTSSVVRNMFDNMYDFPLILSVKIK